MTDNNEGLVERLVALVEGLADQQAMPDDSWRPKLEEIVAALERQPVREEWRPIESAPLEREPMIVVRGYFADTNYWTDPWCVWWQEGAWQRWPHSKPPTHWMLLPPHPVQGDTNEQ